MREEGIFDLGVIAASEEEAGAVIAALSDARRETAGGVRFACGTLGTSRTVVAVCGIGKAAAALCTEAMILLFSPAVVLNIGVAGSLSDRAGVGTVILADAAVQHDLDTSALGDPAGYVQLLNRVFLPADPAVADRLAAAARAEGAPFLRGVLASGDRFVHSETERERIRATFGTVPPGVIACDMEGAAVAEACLLNRVPFGILRAVSDGGDEGAASDYASFLASSARTAARILLRFAGGR